MTLVGERTYREERRRELAELLDLDLELLADASPLDEELGLDSLARMRVLTWLESHGVLMQAVDQERPMTVGEALSLVERTATPGLSIRVTDAVRADAEPSRFGPADFPTPPGDPLAPVLRTTAFVLHPVQPDDMHFLYALATMPETSFRWRFRGVPPSVEKFAEGMWNQVMVQFTARRIDTREPVGHVVAYSPDATRTFAYVGAAFLPEHAGTGLAAQAVVTFVDYLFYVFPLRKLYLEVPGYNWPQIESGQGSLFQVEGVLRDHIFYGGRYWDEYICAIYPSR